MKNTLVDTVNSAHKLFTSKGWDLVDIHARQVGHGDFSGVIIARGAGFSKMYSVHRFTMVNNGFQIWAGSYDLDLESARELLAEKMGA